jgi:gamma-glutamyltranspeptidase / glutathione hydrolase
VSVTYTLNGGYGAQVIAGDTGFFLNNEMDDFTSKVGAPNMYGLVMGEANAIQPGKRPLSSMAPTVVTKDGKLFMVTGSPGGSRIITIVLESIVNVIDQKMDMKAAVNTPRIHHQWMPDTVYVEPGAVTPAVKKDLEGRGYSFTENRNWGSAQAIQIGTRNGKRVLFGANDDRDVTSAAVGY